MSLTILASNLAYLSGVNLAELLTKEDNTMADLQTDETRLESDLAIQATNTAAVQAKFKSSDDAIQSLNDQIAAMKAAGTDTTQLEADLTTLEANNTTLANALNPAPVTP
jgi:septal ring factor EnvC (AmiA/AmiB activator)